MYVQRQLDLFHQPILLKGPTMKKSTLSDENFLYILELLMCYDPVNDQEKRKRLEVWANKEAQLRGYSTWVDAYTAMN